MIFSIYLFLCANIIATIVAYYKTCYYSLSLCLITNIDDGIEMKLNRSSAARWCTDHSSSLAIVTNASVQSAIATFISDSNARLNSSRTDVITNGYRFNLSGWEWINGARSEYPQSVSGSFRYACLVVSTTGSPYVSICDFASDKVKFICTYRLSDPSGSSCSNGYQQMGITCYKVRNIEATWFVARHLCLQDGGSDLAVFDNGIPSITSQEGTNYWIGLRTEKWVWWNGSNEEVIIYSNWDSWNPVSGGGGCLCLKGGTTKFRACDCLQQYRYVCIQDYATGSASTFKPPTTKMTTRTTQTTTATTALKTTHSTRTFIHSVGNSSSSSRYLSAPTQTLDNDSKSNVSDDPLNTHGSEITSGNGILVVLIPIVVLIVLIAVIAAVSCIVIKKLRKRSTTQAVLYVNSSFQPTVDDDYATLKREYLTGNETYAELNAYETIGDEIYKNSK